MALQRPIFADLLEVLPDAVIMVDARGRMVYASSATERLLGYGPHDLFDQPLSLLVPEALRSRHEEMVVDYQRNGSSLTMGERPLLQARHKSGALVPVSISLTRLVLDGEAISVAVVRDATLLDGHLSRAAQMAETDVLTGLANRLHLSRRMQELLAGESPFALLYIDLARFKSINDVHGHEIGDELLRLVGRRLALQVRQGDVAARIGGDEFVMVLQGLAQVDHLAQRAAQVARHLAEPAVAGGVRLQPSGHIGGALYPDDGRSERDLLAAADRRMYAAKRSGLGYCVVDG